MTDHATHVMRTPDGLVIVPFYGCAECNAAVAAAGAHNRRAALAADVARAWVTYRADWGPGSIDHDLAELLDRLAALHGLGPAAPAAEPERTLPDVDRLGTELARLCDVEDVRVTVRDAGTGRLTVRAEVVVDMRATLTHPEPAPRCCDSHVPQNPLDPALLPAPWLGEGRQIARCCDPNDCGPCCAGCPTCPTENARKAR